MSDHSFKRDPKNKGALLNDDSAGLEAYRKAKRRVREIDSVIEDTANLKRELGVIKELLVKILEKI